MPNQASTPRTTRNSRGLRRSPSASSVDSCLGKSARVSRRRRTSGTPARASLVNALASSTHASPATPTPAAPSAQPIPDSPQTPALGTIPEGQPQPQPGTPTPAVVDAVARPPVIPPPVTLPPPTPYLSTPPPRTSPPLEHPRTSSTQSTSPTSARRQVPRRIPVIRTNRYRTVYVDITPTKPESPAPESLGDETRRFRQRRDEEGDDKFTRELWIAIRNDQYMKGCWCGHPNIYNSKEEAEVAAGHLRFYVAGSETKNLRVLQKKDDHRWHCMCGNAEYHPVYKELINANGKRPAEESEVDLIAQNQGSPDRQGVERVLPPLPEPASDNEDQPQSPELPHSAPAQSMWAQAFGMVTRAVITMGGPLATLLGKVRQQFRGDAYETVDVRRKNAQNGIITVKRLKRPAPVPAAEQPHSEGSDDGYERLGWTDDPTKHIGFEQIQSIANGFATQLEIIKAGKVVGGASIADIYMQIQDGEDLHTSIALHKYLEQECGPMSPEDPDDERAAKVLRTLTLYQDRLESGISFMLQVYDCDLFEELKQRYTTPPRRLALGTTVFRQSSMLVGEFLCFLLTLKDVCNIDGATLEAICKMIVDANAIHKQLMPRSFVEEQPNPTEGMPGFFPEDSPMEDVPADELTIQPLYDFKFPEPEPAQSDEPQVEPGDYKLVPKPKGILKPSKEWEDPASPKYVTTPEKKRKLAFKSPVSKFIVPAHVPAKVMTPAEAERIFRAKQRADVLRDEHSIRAFEASRTVARHKNLLVDFEDKWNLEALERDEREMGLSYHARKYDGFLTDLQNDVEKRAKEEEERRWEPTFRPAREQRIVRIPLPPLPSTPERRRRRALLLEGDTRTSFISPGSNPLMRQKTEEEPPKVVEKRPEPRTLEEFFAQDEENDLEISVRKFEQLQIDRQIREELELGLRRDIEDRRRRREEEELREQERRLREEIRRKEEERRREEEARREKEAEEFAALTGLRRPTRRLITSLTGEWDLRVNNAARANPAVELAKTLEGQPLTRRDFEEKLLPPTAWLNDNVIIGSILHIADYINTTKGATNQEPKCAAFTSYFWPRLLSHGPSNCGRLLRRAGVRKANFFDIDTIIIPICDQSHWTLAVIRPERRTVAHIDSMRAGGGHASVKTKLLELVRFILEDQFVESEWRAVDYEAPRQTNGWDCGVFTITNALCMALSLDPKQSYTERELTMQRRRLAAILLNKGFKGEFSLDGI